MNILAIKKQVIHSFFHKVQNGNSSYKLDPNAFSAVAIFPKGKT